MKAEIPTFEEKKLDGKNVVFFKLVVGFVKTNKQWTIDKRYSDFDALDKEIRTFASNMPNLPGKTMFKLSA